MQQPQVKVTEYADELIATPRAHLRLVLEQNGNGLVLSHEDHALIECPLTEDGMLAAGFVAQAHGADDRGEAVATLGRAMVIAVVIGIGLLALQSLIIEGAMAIMEAGADVDAQTRAYYAIRIWSAPAALANYVVLGWFLGMQNARAGLIIQLVINLINIALDLAFVVGLGMAVEGVAMATVIAEYAGLGLGLVMI